MARLGVFAVREASLEGLFTSLVRDAGGIPVKLQPVQAGLPDRLVLWPGGRTSLVELKTRAGRLGQIQALWHGRAARLGHHVAVLYGAEQIRTWVAENA